MSNLQHKESFQPLRNLDINVYVLDYNFKIIDEISGVTNSASVSINADSDIRRTATISMTLGGINAKSNVNIADYDNNKEYRIGDIVLYNNLKYQCVSTHSATSKLVDSSGKFIKAYLGDAVTPTYLNVSVGDGTFIQGILPTDSQYWRLYSQTQQSIYSKYWSAGNPYWFDKYVKIEVGIEDSEYHSGANSTIYDNDAMYRLGDIVWYGDTLYKCINVKSSEVKLVTSEGEIITDSQGKVLTVDSTTNKYVQGIPPVDTGYWSEIPQYIWSNQGIYLINSPTITYNATTNELSFQAVDLMSKLTGMRNGYLDGMTYQIPSGTNINNAITSVLNEQGFVDIILPTTLPTLTTPIDINIDIGSTAYDILVALRDINPNYEMFFDVNGVFRFQEIPSGSEIAKFGSEVWDLVSMGYTLDTSFEDVKNFVEVVGKQIEPDEVATITTSGSTATITLARPYSSYYSSSAEVDVVWYVGFTLGDITMDASLLSTPITSITLKDSSNVSQLVTFNTTYDPAIYYTNESYCLRLTFSSTAYKSGEYAGYLQPRAIAFENNVESPFYVGGATSYVCSKNSIAMTFVNESEVSYLGEIAGVTDSSGVFALDLTTNIQDYESAAIGATWTYKLNLRLSGSVATQANITYGGDVNYKQFVTHDNLNFVTSDNNNFKVKAVGALTTTSAIYYDNTFTSAKEISLDFSGAYLLTVHKTSSGPKISAQYFPIPSSHWESPTVKFHTMPKFNKTVRAVYSGDEYDNIYSNALAIQRAKYELYLRCRLHDTINITCVPLYWLDVNIVIGYTANEEEGEALWIIKSINTDLSIGGTQSITAMRYYPLYNS